MITKVIKRNGTEEEFNPDKLNKWAEWASENCNVSWSDVILEASRSLTETVSTSAIQKSLIEVCVNRKDTGHSRMAARLFVGQIYKEAFEDFSIPSIAEFYHMMVEDGYWEDIGYTDEELAYVEQFIDHTLDFTYEYCTIRQFYDKYAINAYGRCLESPQMALMGVAMSNTQSEPDRAVRAVEAYQELCALKINLPTPSLGGQRTPTAGSPSCCVITGNDSVNSIEAAVHVAYKMTAMSSGIGAELNTRAPKDPVKGGTIEHQGKLGYYRYLDRAVKANRQHSRGGSATVTISAFDPEIDTLLRLKSQRVHPDSRIDSMDYSLGVTNLFMKKVALDEDWLLTSVYWAPNLYELQYSSDIAALETEFNRVMNDSSVKKKVVRAREIASLFFNQRSDVGRIYKTNFTNANTHTPFKEKIRLSNLCQEVLLVTEGFPDTESLYLYKGVGEIALCFLASIVVTRIKHDANGNLDVADYCRTAYQTAKFIDNGIDQASYPFPAVKITAQARRSIGVGITDLAHYMARHGFKYDDVEGRNAVHRIAELHSYALHRASVELAKERGACEWFHKTKYSDDKPWLPIDTYAKAIDEHHTQPLLCDWEGLRADIKKYGMRFSVLEAFMPVESSSVFTASTNGLYPIREKKLFKKSMKGTVYFEAGGLEEYGHRYQNAYSIETRDMILFYGVIQKFTGQSISADFYQDVSGGKKTSMIDNYQNLLLSAKVGLKTWYYLNSQTEEREPDEVFVQEQLETGCEACSL